MINLLSLLLSGTLGTSTSVVRRLSKCAVDVPDASCHWYIAVSDNTFGKGFDWATPWFDANGLSDIQALISKLLFKSYKVGSTVYKAVQQAIELFYSNTFQ